MLSVRTEGMELISEGIRDKVEKPAELFSSDFMPKVYAKLWNHGKNQREEATAAAPPAAGFKLLPTNEAFTNNRLRPQTRPRIATLCRPP